MSPVVSASKRKAPAGISGSKQAASNRAEQTSGKAPQKRRTRGHKIAGANKIVNTLLPGFSRQMAAMLSSGMPIVACLEAQEEQADNPSFKMVIEVIKKNIENGAAFSEALRQFPQIFDDLYCNMVKGGETGGQLAETIGRVAGFLEATARLKRKVKSAMMYPVIVLCIAIGIAIGMILFIVPVFGEMFSDFGAALPTPTQKLLDFSDWLRANGIFVFIGVATLVVAFKKWKQTPNGAYTWDSMVLKAPVFGELAKKIAAARFARTFGQMVRSGVPILSALEIVSGATGNRVAGGIITTVRGAVEKGEPMSSAMQNQSVFPMMLVRMLQAGEKTGKIDDMMDSIADFYDDEVETMLGGLTSLLEPIMMVFLGTIIGGLVLCMFLPIFKMGEVVSG